MHYYSHHIGDMIRDTANLEDHQLATYMRMIWVYYQSEKPLADNLEDIAFAMRSDEKTVRLLLRHYFKLDGDVWRHTRCDKEIADFHSKKEKASQSAKTRWDKSHLMQSECERNADELKNNAIEPKSDANQEPRTKNQEIEEKEKDKKKKQLAQAPSAYADLLSDVPKQVVDDWEKLRKAKKATVTRTAIESIVREAGKAGLTLEQALTECCARGWIGFKADWFTDKKPIDRRHDPPKKSFYERDLELKTARIAELTGRVKPSEKNVIDITPKDTNELAITLG